jgi:hypothetical protein
MSVQEEAIELIRRLPAECTMEDIHYHLYVREKINRALSNLNDGKTLTQEEAERHMSEWLRSFGNKTP